MTRPLALSGAPLVLPGGPQQATLRVGKGRIVDVADGPAPGDVIVDLSGHVLYPGLVNAHDHLEFNHFPHTKWRDTYPNAHAWGRDALTHLDDPDIAALTAAPLRDRLYAGGLKNLLAGTTTVAHHDPLFRALRARRFPVEVVRRYGWAHSLVFDDDLPGSYRRTPRDAPWIVHLAEGTDQVAARELAELEQLGCLGGNTLLVHGVGLSGDDRQRAIAVGAGLVWCPASNVFLLGQTASVEAFAQAGLLALGTDSRLTGTRDLLEEMKFAAEHSQLDARQLFEAVTRQPARLLRLSGEGRIVPGGRANLVALRASGNDPYPALLSSSRADLALVMLGGRPRLSDPDLSEIWAATETRWQPVTLDGKAKRLAHHLARQQARTSLPEPGLHVGRQAI